MDIPVLNIITDFEALHQNPSNYLISKTSLSISAIATVSHACTFWKWATLLLLALLAALLNPIKFLSFRRLPSDTLFQYQSDADTSSDDDQADYESDESSRRLDEDFRVRGSAHSVDDRWQSRNFGLRHRRSIGDLFSCPDLASGKSVVKLWDNLGLGLDFQDDGNVFSLHDMNKEQEIISSFLSENCDVPAISASSSAVVMAAGVNNSRNIELKVWDRRVSCRIPQILGEWQSQMVDFEKLWLTVGDMRKANAPLKNVTESEMNNWWDADAVMVTDEFFDNSAMGRCCDAVRSQLLLGREPNL